MLVLTRKAKEKIFIDDRIEVVVLEVRGKNVRLGFTAPDDVHIQREEIRQRDQSLKQPVAKPVAKLLEVLLIEDNLMDARIAMQAMKASQLPHRITLVRDGQEALEFLFHEGRFARAPQPNLILLDLALPKVNGGQVLTEIKSDYGLKHIPVVVLTASAAEEDRVHSRLLNAEGFLRKPVDFVAFRELIHRLALDQDHEARTPW